jgi:phage baseplate assembly protein W
MENASALPSAVRQNYQQALDGLDALAAQPTIFGASYNDQTASLARAEAGAAGDVRTTLESRQAAGPPESAAQLATQRERSTDLDIVDAQATPTGHTFGDYAGTVEYAITNADTVESIAAHYLGHAARWFDIVLLNGLQPPYISETGAPGTVGIGDIIVIPTTVANPASAVGASDKPGLDLLGTDLALVDTALSAPGRPVVDLAIDEGTLTDLRVIGGIDNLAQAIQMRLWTESGSMPNHPKYGVRRSIGVTQTEGFLSMLQINYREALNQENRIQRVPAFRFEVSNDIVEISIDAVPIGETNAQTITVLV